MTVKRKRTAKKKARGGSKGGQPRRCGECGELGHTSRSHQPGGRLA